MICDGVIGDDKRGVSGWLVMGSGLSTVSGIASVGSFSFSFCKWVWDQFKPDSFVIFVDSAGKVYLFGAGPAWATPCGRNRPKQPKRSAEKDGRHRFSSVYETIWFS